MEANIDSKMWTDPIVKALIDILVEEVQKGNMPNGVFHSRTWTSMTARLNSVTNCSFNVKQLKQKVNRLRSMHREFTLLLKHTGFGWSAETNTVTASEEVWQNYLQAHEKAAQFRKKGCDHYKLLGIIFNRSTATGVLYHSST
ncbi:L10-interacting MYB domain-containing protein-like [Prosopis cineraria]|uniref:L10-interacting MYB domain-containing protein-like n=1 Tax=Prosopis cineraria TaxID=364024 RepID=UPI00240EF2A5|nr:L10-interacting MYB domain-containing protein-like [Prosopis cineraria]